ncbi:MAG: cell division protein FtsQ/DivIB [Novosphingobium sp.]
MSRKISRKPTTARRAAAARGTERKVRAAKGRTGSAIGRVLSLLPIGEERLHQAMLAAILGGAVVLAWFVASFAGIPAMAQRQLAAVAAEAGFRVNNVSVRGTKHLNELKVYERVLGESDRAMTQVDLHALRTELLALSWVEDARVSRQLPDTLVIDIVERRPHAVLRKPDRLVLIDAAGHELEPVSAARARKMLVVSGPAAGKQIGALGALLEAAPALQPQVREAEWVGNRRWNLTFRTGQVLALPEGGKASSKALVEFARLDGVNRLLGGRALAFDMRAPDRIYFRMPARAAEPPKPAPVASTSAKPAAKAD